MTITITKAKLALAVLAVALIVPATAWAAGVFDDVPDGRYFTEAAEWAAAEGITTGVSTDPPLFAPDDPVTRGQNVTFLKRYHDNIVVPADEALQADIDATPALYIARELDSGYQNLPQNVATDLGSLDVPAGSYLFSARVLVNNNDANPGSFDCTFAAGGDEDNFSGGGITIGGQAVDDREIASLQFAETLATDGTVSLTCTSGTSSSNAGRVVISALEVGDITETVINN